MMQMMVVLVLLVPAKPPNQEQQHARHEKGAFNVKPQLQNKNSCSKTANGAHVIRSGSTFTYLAASLQYLPTQLCATQVVFREDS